MSGAAVTPRAATSDDVLALVRDVLGVTPLRAERQTFGHNSVTFDVILPDGNSNVIVRTNVGRVGIPPGPSAICTPWPASVCPFRRCSPPTCPSAAIRSPTWSCPRSPARDLRYELGVMTEAQMTRLAEQIVGFQRTVMTALPPGEGFGYVPIGECGPRASWWDLIRPNPGSPLPLVGNPAFADLARRVLRQLTRREAYLRAIPPTCFLDDITVKNVIVERGELRGLVDFDVVCYGDPLFWLSLTAVGIVCDVGMRELFYVDELCRCLNLSNDERQVFALYAAWIGLDFVERFATSETPNWRDRMRGAITRWLTQSEP
jgi:hypothetical protein